VAEVSDRVPAVTQGDPHGEIPSQGKPHDEKRGVSFRFGDILNGPVSLLDKGAVKESLVEVVAPAVVAEVQAENIIPLPKKESPGSKHIGGVRPSLPPVEKENQSAGRSRFLARVKPEQADAVSRVDQDLTGLPIQLFLPQRPDFPAG